MIRNYQWSCMNGGIPRWFCRKYKGRTGLIQDVPVIGSFVIHFYTFVLYVFLDILWFYYNVNFRGFLFICFVLTCRVFKNTSKTPETKRWNLGLTPCPPSLNKTRNKNMHFQSTFLLHPITSHTLPQFHRLLKYSKTQT